MNSAMKEFCPRQIKEMISRVCLWALHPVSRPAAVSEHHAAVCWTCSVTETRCRAETFVLSEHLWYFCLCVTTGCNRQPDILILQPLRRTDHRKRSSAWCIKSKLNQPWDAVRPFQILSQRLLLSHSHTQTYTHTHTHTHTHTALWENELKQNKWPCQRMSREWASHGWLEICWEKRQLWDGETGRWIRPKRQL